MYQILVKFVTSDGNETLTALFDSVSKCHQFRESIPNVQFWSISPIKILSPIEQSDSLVVPLNINVTYRRGGRDVINELTPDSVLEWFKNLDFKDVSEIRFRVDPFNRVFR